LWIVVHEEDRAYEHESKAECRQGVFMPIHCRHLVGN
jgi:hypothetical protein